MASEKRQVFTEGSNTKAVRGLMIALAALVVLAVSAYGTVIYVQLMGNVFPDGPLLIACYLGAAANVLLMIVLLVGKFVWFRPGAHEVASWIVTGVELSVSILNMMLAFELASAQKLSSLMQAWYFLAPVSPIFSMVGAILLIMTSTELRTKHREMELQESKDQANRAFELAMHTAEVETKYQYLGFIKTKLQQELNAPERHLEMQDHAAMLVSDVLSGLSGMQSVPRLKSPPLLNERTIEPPQAVGASAPATRSLADPRLDEGDAWLAQVNSRIEQERTQQRERDGSALSDTGNREREQHKYALVARFLPLFLDNEEQIKNLSSVERRLGIETPPPPAGHPDWDSERPLVYRLERVMDALLKMGISDEKIEHMASHYFTQKGGEDAKKK